MDSGLSSLCGAKRDFRSAAGGAVMVEFLIAYLPVLMAFLMFWQLGELLVAQMVVERASSAAGRAAIVVVPDDPAFYDGEVKGDFTGERKREIRLAAGMMLAASPHLSENFTVDVTGVPTGDDQVQQLTVTVQAEFRCTRLRWVCGIDGLTVLSSPSQHTYHGANYEYEPVDLSAINVNANPADPSCSETGTGGAGGKGSGGGGVPGKGGASGKGGNGGRGGAGGDDPDNSGSCPAGQTEQVDGTCVSSRGGGKCKNGSADPDGMCPDGTCVDTGKKPPAGADPMDPCSPSKKRCALDDGAAPRKRKKTEKVPPGYIAGAQCPGDTIEKDIAGAKQCCQQKPNTNGECPQDYECMCEIANNAPGHSADGAFVSKDGSTSLNFPDGLFPKECGESDSCKASGNDTKKTGAQIVDDYRIKQFNAMCNGTTKGGVVTYVKDQLLTQKKKQFDKLSPAGQAVWKQTNKYCNDVQAEIDKNGGSPVGIMLSGSLLQDEKDLVDEWGTDGSTKLTPSDVKIFQNQWGTGSNATHTEPKAIALIRAWAEEKVQGDPKAFLAGGTFTLSPRAGGTASPCDKCDLDLEAFAAQFDVTIKYTFTSVYGTGLRANDPEAKKAWFWSPPGTTCTDPKPGNSLALDGTITYSPNTGAKTFSNPATPICCK